MRNEKRIDMSQMIQVADVCKTYCDGTVVALDQVCFSAEEGSIIGIVGRNGAGKSTLFKIICSVIPFDSGSVMIRNKNARIDQISYLPEVRGLSPKQLVGEHLVDLLCYKGIKRSDAKMMVKLCLLDFGVDEFINRRIDTLSKGNQQKIQFISAVANKPEILILDEPFSGLDIIAADFFWEIINRLSQQGTTILFSTHVFGDKLTFCDQFMFLVKGKIVEYGALDVIRRKNPYILELNCSEVSQDLIKDALGDRGFAYTGDGFTIILRSEDDAKQIYQRLGMPYCKKFVVRKLRIDELFRKYNDESYI